MGELGKQSVDIWCFGERTRAFRLSTAREVVDASIFGVLEEANEQCSDENVCYSWQMGSLEGASAMWLAENLLKHPASLLICLDTWDGGPDLVPYPDIEMPAVQVNPPHICHTYRPCHRPNDVRYHP